MEEILDNQQIIKSKTIALSLDERESLVGAFAWLIQEDKKQNPKIYQPKTNKYD